MASLKQVVVVSRHGIRGPYGLGSEIPNKATLETYVRNAALDLPLSAVAWGTSETEDPHEIVSPKLTRHGFRVIQRMGEYFRQYLYHDFLGGGQCASAFAYADDNQRDNLTARAFLEGMYPSCRELLPITNGTRLLFEQGEDPTAICPVCSRTVYEGITGANDSRYLIQGTHDDIAAINSILQCCAPKACGNTTESAAAGSKALAPSAGSSTSDECTLFGIPPKWTGAFYCPWDDALSVADYFSEWFTLQALNNMTIPKPLTFEKILALARVHEAHMDLVTNEVNSANFGATLLAHITASMQQAATGKKVDVASGDGPQILQSLDNQFLFYAGHDINLMYLRNILRLQWYSSEWHPHEPTPGGMIIFELHSSEGNSSAAVRDQRQLGQTTSDEDSHYVKAYFVTASPNQMRNAEALSPENPPDVVPVIIPLCSQDVELADGRTEVRCPFTTFKSLVGRTLKHSCVADTLRPYVDSLPSSGGSISASRSLRGVELWGLLTISACLLFALLFVLRRSHLRALAAQRERKPSRYGSVPQSVSIVLESKVDREDSGASSDDITPSNRNEEVT